MAERNLIQQTFDAFGKRAGMLKQSGTWYRATDDVTQAVNLQKSQYCPSYYISLAWDSYSDEQLDLHGLVGLLPSYSLPRAIGAPWRSPISSERSRWPSRRSRPARLGFLRRRQLSSRSGPSVWPTQGFN